MILVISGQGENGKTVAYSFALADSFDTGYTVRIDPHLRSEASRTHPWVLAWAGSEINDLNIKLELVVGVLEDTKNPTWMSSLNNIRTPENLLEIIEGLHNFALPIDREPTVIQVIDIFVSNGQTQPWFHRRGILSSIQCKFKHPWDVDTGLPMAAELSLTIKHHFGAATHKDVGPDNTKLLPHRPWKFGKLWN